MNPIDLTQFDAVLLDLDGTLWHEEVALPGAVELIHALQSRGQAYAFVTNSGLSPARLIERLARMGVAADAAHVYTAAAAGCDYVRQRWPRGVRVFSVAGLACAELLDGYASWVADDRSPADVVMSASLVNPNASLERFQFATRHLLAGAPLVALCADRSYPTPRGIEIGAGAVASMLAYAADVTPIYCGKPQRVFFAELCAHLDVRPDRCVLIGDNLESDIAGARPLGIKTILRLTGVTTRAKLEHEVNHRPDWVIDDLNALRP